MRGKRQGGSSTHTSFFKGSKIRIIFRDGSVTIAKFIDKKNRKLMRVQLASGDIKDIRINDLASCNYFKPLAHERI